VSPHSHYHSLRLSIDAAQMCVFLLIPEWYLRQSRYETLCRNSINLWRVSLNITVILMNYLERFVQLSLALKPISDQATVLGSTADQTYQ